MWTGYPLKSKEGQRLVAGKGKFLADIRLPGELSLAFLRSPHARARIESIDVSAALKCPGVVAAVTGDDLAGAIRPVPEASEVLRPASPVKLPAFYPLAVGKAHFSGEPVAAVVAEDRYAAEDALALIKVEYNPLPPVVDAEEAMRPDSPVVFEELGNNVPLQGKISLGDVESAFRQAAHVFKQRFRMARSGYPPLETLGCIASYDPHSGLTLWSTSQRVHTAKVALCDILGLPADKVRVVAPLDIGGGFGWKAPIFREPLVACYLARKLGRPIKWVQDRLEAFQASHERDEIQDMEMACDADGTIRGLRVRTVHDVGCGLIDMYAVLAASAAAGMVPGAYDIPNLEVELCGVITNKTPQGINRPAVKLPIVFAFERMIDIAARELGMDPAQMRLKNLIAQVPHTTPAGGVLQECDFTGTFKQLLDTFGYEKMKGEVADLRKQGRYIGIGVAGWIDHLWPVSSSIGERAYGQPFYASARVKLETDGTVMVFTGDSPQGQCRDTSVSQVVADELGVHPYDIVCVMGDTQSSPFNNHGVHTHTAALLAAREVRAKIIRVAAHLLKLDPDEGDFDLKEGKVVWCEDESKCLSLREIARAAWLRPQYLPLGMQPGIESTKFHEATAPPPAGYSAHAFLVEVDADTAQFKILKHQYVGDAGTVLNPLMLEGSAQGAVSSALSQGAYEEYVYDENGQLLTTTLMDYLMATAAEVPEIKIGWRNIPTSSTPLGDKKMISEGVGSAVPPALANAIADALQAYGVKITELPLTPARIWQEMKLAKS